METEKHPLEDLKNDEIPEKREKWEMHTVGPGIWQEKLKEQKMRITLVRQWNVTRNIEKYEKWEMHTVGPGIWTKNWKSRKMRHTQFKRWNMVTKTEKVG